MESAAPGLAADAQAVAAAAAAAAVAGGVAGAIDAAAGARVDRLRVTSSVWAHRSGMGRFERPSVAVVFASVGLFHLNYCSSNL